MCQFFNSELETIYQVEQNLTTLRNLVQCFEGRTQHIQTLLIKAAPDISTKSFPALRLELSSLSEFLAQTTEYLAQNRDIYTSVSTVVSRFSNLSQRIIDECDNWNHPCN